MGGPSESSSAIKSYSQHNEERASSKLATVNKAPGSNVPDESTEQKTSSHVVKSSFVTEAFTTKMFNSNPRTHSKSMSMPRKSRSATRTTLRVERTRRKKVHRTRRSIIVAAIVGIILLMVAATIICLIIIVSGRPICSPEKEKFCQSGLAECVIGQKGGSECQCISPQQRFYGNRCEYSCEREPLKECPKGVCYLGECQPDILSFVLMLFEAECGNLVSSPGLKVHCSVLMNHVCRMKSLHPQFCQNGKKYPDLEKFYDYACQVGDGNGYQNVTDWDACSRSPHCQRLLLIYPCFKDYVSSGVVNCSRHERDHAQGKLCYLEAHTPSQTSTSTSVATETEESSQSTMWSTEETTNSAVTT